MTGINYLILPMERVISVRIVGIWDYIIKRYFLSSMNKFLDSKWTYYLNWKSMVKKIENYVHHFLVTFMTILTSTIVVGIPATLLYLITKAFLNKGRNSLLTVGLLSAFVIIYFGILHSKTKTLPNHNTSITPKLLVHCVKVGSIFLYISLGLIFIHLSLYFFS